MNKELNQFFSKISKPAFAKKAILGYSVTADNTGPSLEFTLNPKKKSLPYLTFSIRFFAPKIIASMELALSAPQDFLQKSQKKGPTLLPIVFWFGVHSTPSLRPFAKTLNENSGILSRMHVENEKLKVGCSVFSLEDKERPSAYFYAEITRIVAQKIEEDCQKLGQTKKLAEIVRQTAEIIGTYSLLADKKLLPMPEIEYGWDEMSEAMANGKWFPSQVKNSDEKTKNSRSKKK